jgi:integrase
MPPRHRAMLLLATFASLRFGELAALRRSDLDLDGCVVRVVRSFMQMNDGRLIEQEPKSRAGRRTVSFPREIVGELRWHLERFAELVLTAWSSSARWVVGCAGQTSATSGS